MNGYAIDRKLTAARANGLVFQVDGSLTVCDSRSGGKITGGYNTENGGGLFVRGALTVEGGSVTGNASDKAGGGVYLDANATLQVSGTAQVAENTAQSVGNNVYLPDGKVIAIGSAGLSNGASIGVTTETPPGKDSPVNVSAAIQTDFSAYFVSDIGYLTRFDASASAPAIQFVQSALAVSLDGVYFKGYEDSEMGWNAAIASGGADPVTVRLMQDWTAAANASCGTSFGTGAGFGDGTGTPGALLIPQGKNVLLDLNGCTLDRALTEKAWENGYVVWARGNLTVRDSAKGGAITGGNNTQSGGGIYASPGSCALEGGTIFGNSAKDSGGIYKTYTFTDITLSGGVIRNNTAASQGGGVYLDTGYCTLKGTVIHANVASQGGGLYVQQGVFTMQSGDILDNNGTVSGGGAYLSENSATCAFSGGTLKNNTAANAGGGIYVEGDRCVFSGTVEVTGNTAGDDASNVYLLEDRTFGIGENGLQAGARIGVRTAALPATDAPVGLSGANNADYSAFFASDLDEYTIINDASNALRLSRSLDYALYYNASDGYLHQGGLNGAVCMSVTNGKGLAYTGSGNTLTIRGGVFVTDAATALVMPIGSTLTVEGFNTLVSTYAGAGLCTAVNNGASLTINGTGTLNATSGTSTDDFSIGLSTGNLTIKGTPTLRLTGGNGAYSCGIFVAGTITYQGGEIFAKSGWATELSRAVTVFDGAAIDAGLAEIRIGPAYGEAGYVQHIKTADAIVTELAQEPPAYAKDVRIRKSNISVTHDHAAYVGYNVLADGWNAAVDIRLNNARTAVKLYGDWTAEPDAARGTSFGKGYGFGISTVDSGNIYVPAGMYIQLDLNGHTIDRALTSNIDLGYVLAVHGDLTVEDSRTGGVIKGGFNNARGGGIYVANAPGSALRLTGGTITGNRTHWGGGVYSESDFTMTGGAITGNIATDNGGGVYIDTIYSRAACAVSGSARIENNTVNDAANNVYLQPGQIITVSGALDADARIGVTSEQAPNLDTPIDITATNTADYSGNFTSDIAGFRAIDARSGDARIVRLAVAAATIADGTIDGVKNARIAKKELAVTLTDEAFRTLRAGTIVSDWFPNMPDGLIAWVKEDVESGASALTVVVSGIPTRICADAIACTLPASVLSGRAPLATEMNENARWAITGAGSIVFTVEPDKKLEVDKGGSASLSAQASIDTAAAVALTWYACDERGAILSGALGTGETFAIPETDKERISYYRCEATSLGAEPVYSRIAAVVVGNPVTAITMIAGRTMTVGEEGYCQATFAPDGAKRKHCYWSSDDDTVASVSAAGLVTAKKAGTAKITATSKTDSAVTVSCLIVVAEKVQEARLEEIVGGVPRDALSVAVGGKLNLTTIYGGLYAWSSDDASIATVDAKGVLRGKAPGTTTIRGTLGMTAKTPMIGDEIALQVTVVKKGYAVTKIKLSPTSLKLDIGAEKTLTATCSPAKATDKTIVWTTGNAEIAVVDSEGRVTGVGAGKTKITATAASGVRKSITVTVSRNGAPIVAPPPTQIAFTADARTQKVGEKIALGLAATPANADLSGTTWESADDTVAAVDAFGVVTGVSVGTTTVTAKYGALYTTCRVTVEEEDKPEETLTLTVDFLAIAKGGTLGLNGLTGFRGSWKSADTAIATVSSAGTLKAKREGETTLTFTVGAVLKKNARFMGKALLVGDSIDVKLIVVGKGKAVTKIKLAGATIIAPGERSAIAATISPKKAIHQELFWKSENTDIAIVDELGVVTGVGNGKVKITATATSGKTKSITVTVSDTITKLTLNKTKLNLKRGKTYQLEIKAFLPAGLPAPAILWTSSKETVASVDPAGFVTALKKGKTTIYATDAAGGVKAKCAITVK